METETLFHNLFWVLFAGMMTVRVLSVVQVRRTGERFMPDKQAVEREGKGTFAVRVVGFLLLLGILIAYGVNPPWMQLITLPIPAGVRWAGFGLGLLGLALWGCAQSALARQWSAQIELRDMHNLVTSGPYAWVRHPLYAALIAVSVSVALVTANCLFIAFCALAIGMLPSRIIKEEKMMLEGVPGYREYRERVKFRVLPGVW